MHRFRPLDRSPRRGFSLVEMIAATALVAGTLAPALAVMRDAMSASREAHRRHLMANYAVTVLEYAAAASMQNWGSDAYTGNFASDGYPTIRYQLTRSDNPASGGVAGRLLHLQATVYDDVDKDSIADATESKVRYRTKVAKLLNYENEPN
jgi:prepilin-type N-terminal cleavage/methylation domain-containing protein